ncbi:TIGR03757 family integrating conjugative element protein [Diaphorobacter sp. HDW4A]|uniref:TIGR03757 family integrating conjugative element protein n=1 Tax=Diaphorobacter sp. HDW4A TaxID=2714924 RepID=UPI00140C4808|nr:TIGR03757 family integrating conjugative element protein [Diaphorobacter sp. HDW4A]QIL80334.1 TIGR03757 family integrating conjugative element protein [Diaphorobacter sp. HDW4A]
MRIHQHRRFVFVALALALALPAGAQTPQNLHAGVTRVEVFANMAMSVTPASAPDYRHPYQLSIYRLDAMNQIRDIASAGMPRDEAGARRWLAANEARIRRQVQPMVASAVNGILLARRYRIDRLPAVVVNQRYVVYGHTDVDQALAALRMSRQPGR